MEPESSMGQRLGDAGKGAQGEIMFSAMKWQCHEVEHPSTSLAPSSLRSSLLQVFKITLSANGELRILVPYKNADSERSRTLVDLRDD